MAVTSCDNGGGGGGGGGGGDPDLAGTITISPATASTGQELTATYSGTESVSFQWKKDGSNIGTASTTNPNKYTTTAEGSYTVTISATGYKSKTSVAVTVTVPSGPQWTAIDTGMSFDIVDDGTIYKVDITAIAYGNNKFVAVGYGKIATSTDGETWTTVTNSTFGTSGIEAIAYGDGKFVAGGEGGKMATSTDGETWTAVDTGTLFDYVFSDGTTTKVDITEISWGNNKFVAGGKGGKMATSSDSITWTAVADSPVGTTIDHPITVISYGNNKFVAGGYVEFNNSNIGKMAYSTDGSTWTDVNNSTFGTSIISAIAYGSAGNKFVAGGSSGKMATSTDGETWTTVTNSTFGTNAISAIAYGNNKFVAGGWNGKMATSTDGATWTAVSNSTFGTSSIYAIAYGNNRFVAGGRDSKMAYLSDN
jgi:hypothetical protein